jgi:pimeloyl-ACP methyl ester carboxylesterase
MNTNLSGRAPTALLLPGTGGSVARDFAALSELLSAHLAVAGYDYRSDRGATYESMVAEVAAHRRATPDRRFLLIGYSLSAAIAVSVAAAVPEQVVGVVLIAGFAEGKDPRLVNEFRNWQHLIEQSPASFAHRVLLLGHHASVVAGFSEAEIERRVNGHLETADLAQTMAQIAIDLEVDLGALPGSLEQPVLVIGCSGDRIVPEIVTRELAEQFPNASYTVVEAGHFAPVERPECVVEAVSRWWRELSLEAASDEGPVGSAEPAGTGGGIQMRHAAMTASTTGTIEGGEIG